MTEWHGQPARELLLGTCNVIFWRLIIATDTLPMGWVTTPMHALLFVLQSLAAWSVARVSSP